MSSGEQTRAIVVLTPSGEIVADTLAGLEEVARLFIDGGMAPKNSTIPGLMCCMIAGRRLGLSLDQSIQGIAAINQRPTIWGDHALGVVQASGLLERIEESIVGDQSGAEDSFRAVCRVKRKGLAGVHEATFSVREAKRAGLWGKPGPWTQYPRRMLAMRARAFALRDRFADVLRGIGIAEEVLDIPTSDYTVTTGATPTAAAAHALAMPAPREPIPAPNPDRESVRRDMASRVEAPTAAHAAVDIEGPYEGREPGDDDEDDIGPDDFPV